MAKRKANIEANQSLHDLAMQAYGNPEGYWQLAQDNDLDDPTQQLEVGGELSFLETTSPIQEDYIRRGRRVATGRMPKQDGAFACAFAPGFNQRGCVFVQSDFNLELDGANDFGKANGNDLTIWNLTTEPLTFSIWARIDDFQGRDGRGNSLFSIQEPTQIDDGIIFLQQPGSGDDNFSFFVNQSQIDFEIPNLQETVWHHFTVIKPQNSDTWQIYMDGNFIVSPSMNSLPSNAKDRKLWLGSFSPQWNSGKFQRPLTGAMTEFIAQTKEISAQEITDRANNLGISDTQNVIAWYALDQDSGGTVSDLSGNANDIDLQGYTSAELAAGGGAWVEFDPNP